MNAMKAGHKIEVSRDDLHAALVEFEKLCDSQQNHHAIRVDADGKVRVTTDTGWSVGEGEFNRRMPHTVTVKHAAGNGQCNLPEDWSDDGVLLDDVDRLIEELERAGYQVVELE